MLHRIPPIANPPKLIVLLLCLCYAQLMGQTDDPKKFMYPILKDATFQYGDSANLEIILDATHLLCLPGVEELETIDAIVVAKSFIAKVLNHKGIDAADITSPLYFKDDYSDSDSWDKIIIRGRTLTPDGQIIELDPNEVTEIKTSSGYRQKVFSLPGVETGAIIQYEYEVTYRYNVQFSEVFEIRNPFPTKYMLFKVIVPSKWEIKYDAFPPATVFPPTREPTGSFGTQDAVIWKFGNVRPFESDDYIPAPSFVVPKIFFGTLYTGSFLDAQYRRNWKDYGRKTLWESFDNKIKGGLEINDFMSRFMRPELDRKKKTEEVFYFLQDSFQVSSSASLPAQTALETFKERNGNSADLAVLYHEMLKQLKIKSCLAVLRTRHQGAFPREVPMSNWFDETIVLLPDEGDTVWINLSSKTSQFGILPVANQGVDALVMAGDDTKFTRTPAVAIALQSNNLQFHVILQENGDLKASCLRNYSGEFDRLARDEYRGLYEREIREKLRSLVVSHYPYALLKNYTISDVKDYSTNFTVSFDFEVPHFVAKTDTNNLLYFEPFLLTESKLLPMLPTRPRQYPVQFAFENLLTTMVTWDIPKSFQIISVPKSNTLKSSFADCISTFENAGNSIRAERSFLLKNNTIARKDVEILGKLAKLIYAHGNAKIILRKRS